MLRQPPAVLVTLIVTVALLAVLSLTIQPIVAQPITTESTHASVPPLQPDVPQTLNITPTNAISLTVLGTYETGAYSTARSAAEIVDYDPVSQTLYVVNNSLHARYSEHCESERADVGDGGVVVADVRRQPEQRRRVQRRRCRGR